MFQRLPYVQDQFARLLAPELIKISQSRPNRSASKLRIFLISLSQALNKIDFAHAFVGCRGILLARQIPGNQHGSAEEYEILQCVVEFVTEYEGTK